MSIANRHILRVFKLNVRTVDLLSRREEYFDDSWKTIGQHLYVASSYLYSPARQLSLSSSNETELVLQVDNIFLVNMTPIPCCPQLL